MLKNSHQKIIELSINRIISEYNLGILKKYEKEKLGYEDLNIFVSTTKGKYLIKFFLKDKSLKEIRGNISSIIKSQHTMIPHPKIYKFNDKILFFSKEFSYALVMDYIGENNFYKMKRLPTKNETLKIANYLSKLHNINFKLTASYNPWLLINIEKEFDSLPNSCNLKKNTRIKFLIQEIKKIDFEKLPKSFIHGDLVSTNILIYKKVIYFIDYSRACYLPRIIDLAILFSDLFFTDNYKKHKVIYNDFLTEYQKNNFLTDQELRILPLLIQATHVMYIIGSTKEILNGNQTQENIFWNNLGYKGINLKEYFFYD